MPFAAQELEYGLTDCGAKLLICDDARFSSAAPTMRKYTCVVVS